MFEKYFQIAGILVRMTGPEKWEPESYGALTAFLAEPGEWDYEIDLEVVETLSGPKGECVFREPGLAVYRDGEVLERYTGPVAGTTENAYLKARQKGNASFVELNKGYLNSSIPSKTMLNSMQAEHLITEQNGFLLHASAISHKGKAVLFTAPSGTGKSTQADLWKKIKGTQIINGDRAGVRIVDDKILVYGVPFSGSSKICENAELPLGAIVYLSQNAENRIERLTDRAAFLRIWEGCSINIWNRNDVAKCSDTISEVINRVPVFHLSCRKDGSAVGLLEHALEMEGY